MNDYYTEKTKVERLEWIITKSSYHNLDELLGGLGFSGGNVNGTEKDEWETFQRQNLQKLKCDLRGGVWVNGMIVVCN